MDLKSEESIPYVSQAMRQEETFNILQHKLNPSKLNLLAFLQRNASLIDDPITNDISSYLQGVGLHHLIAGKVSVESLMDYAESRINKMMKNKRIKKNWNNEDLKVLVSLVSLYGKLQSKSHLQFSKQDWQQISQLIPGTDRETVMFKWLSLSKKQSSEKFWSEQEKSLLQSIIKEEGSENWSRISKLLYNLNPNPNKIFRTPKKCRQFWNCYLNPKLKKGPWKNQEDQLLMSLVIQNQGRKKWSQFVKEFQGRTENALKNRFNLLVSKFQKKWAINKIEEFHLVHKIFYHYQELIASQLLLSDQNCQISEQNKEKQNIPRKVKRVRVRTDERDKNKEDGDWLQIICKSTNYVAYQKIRGKIPNSDLNTSRITRKQEKKASLKILEEQIMPDQFEAEKNMQIEEAVCKNQEEQIYEKRHSELSESALYLMDWSEQNYNLKKGSFIQLTNSFVDPVKSKERTRFEEQQVQDQLRNEQSRFSFDFN